MDQRLQFALESIQPGTNMTQLCHEYGISKPTGYKWQRRFLEQGGSGLADQSRRPRRHPAELSEEVICRIIRLKKRKPFWGPAKIRSRYERIYAGEVPSLSSIKRILDRAGLVQKRPRRPHRTSGRLQQPLKAEECHDVWTVDFKGWWMIPGEGRCEPLTVRDEASRYLLALRHMHPVTTAKVKEVFEELFRDHGLPKAIRSDNGSPFACPHSVWGLTELSAWWLAQGIDVIRGRPGKPQDNGAHERIHRDISEQLEAHRCDSLLAQQRAFDAWREEFNYERPHEALGQCPPAEVFTASPRSWKESVEDLEYEAMMRRKVSSWGSIRYHGDAIWISTALRGWSVGVAPSDGKRADVYFANLLLGHIDLETALFARADISTGESKQKRHA